MDHTFIRYNTKNFETLVYNLVIERLIKNKQYPVELRNFQLNFSDAIRGLIIDSNSSGAITDKYIDVELRERHGSARKKRIKPDFVDD